MIAKDDSISKFGKDLKDIVAPPGNPAATLIIWDSITSDVTLGSDAKDAPNDGKKFVRQLREDGKGFEEVEVDDHLPERTGGQRRDRKKAKAARKARKRRRKK